MGAFSARERKALAQALRGAGEAGSAGVLECPACGSELSRREVPPSKQVSYVRRRVWLLCPGCKRTGAVDVRDATGGGPP